MSRFLPNNYDKSRPLALIAGQGTYPMELAAAARAAGVTVRLIGFEGETAPELLEQFEDRVVIKVGQVGKLIQALKAFKAPYAVMAGQITPKRLFRGLHPDFQAIKLLLSVKKRNAETLFGALADAMAKEGTQLLDARVFLDDALVPLGVSVKGRWMPSAELLEDAKALARSIADNAIGQGLVIDSHGTVLAVEAFEGTDAMLQRAGSFGASKALFVKTTKQQQDYRFDVPVFGPRTAQTMADNGIHAAALAAGSTLMVQKAQTLALCKKHGLSILGI